MRRRVELRRARVEEVLVSRRVALQGAEHRKEQLQVQIDRAMQLSRAVGAASRQLQEAKEVLSVEKARLGDLQRLLRMRQQSMIGQVAALYPVKVFHGLPHEQNLDADANGAHETLYEENGTLPEENGIHVLNVLKFPQLHALTFFGWQIGKHRRKQKDFSERDLQRSATVLGYAAHAVLLIASYLHVPLRYPVHFGGSRSYASDCLPSAETVSIASAERSCINMTNPRLTAYPLFVECQEDDSTKASYAIYLLRKDTEQLLNYIGAESSGRRVFDNLQELIRIIQSDEYVYM
uniref:UV radiation resistance-associated gene protein n=2 Tax=Oryza brachyantha TaxID=4533 RepID=J3M8D2_ORYBR